MGLSLEDFVDIFDGPPQNCKSQGNNLSLFSNLLADDDDDAHFSLQGCNSFEKEDARVAERHFDDLDDEDSDIETPGSPKLQNALEYQRSSARKKCPISHEDFPY